MSLDVYLDSDKEVIESCCCPHCDNEHEITKRPLVYHANITHNLGAMANAAGVYDCLWRPDENGITTAHQLIKPLQKGLLKLAKDPKRWEALNPSNGWGSYEGLLKFVKDYLEACHEFPNAQVRVWR